MYQSEPAAMRTFRKRLILLYRIFFLTGTGKNKTKKRLSTDRVILGIDPGTTVMGYGILHVSGKKMKLLEMDVLALKKTESHPVKLKGIFECII